MKKKKYHGKRALLNKTGNESTAAIVAEIEDTSTWRPGKKFSGDAITSQWQACPNHMIIKISDCSRSVDLSVNIYTEEKYLNSLHKLDTMIDALSAMRMGIVTERSRFLDRVKELPKEEQIEEDD